MFPQKKALKRKTLKSLSGGGRTRTCDLEVMSLASYQLLYPASNESFFNDEVTIPQVEIFSRGGSEKIIHFLKLSENRSFNFWEFGLAKR